jgi:hypothetical protein
MECPWENWLMVGIVYFLSLFATALVFSVVYDLYALRQIPPWRTVSRDILGIGNRFTSVALIATGGFGFVAGCLCGHLFLQQNFNP